MKKTTETLNERIAAFSTEDDKFIAYNAPADDFVIRARKDLQEIIALAKARRTEIIEEKNADVLAGAGEKTPTKPQDV